MQQHTSQCIDEAAARFESNEHASHLQSIDSSDNNSHHWIRHTRCCWVRSWASKCASTHRWKTTSPCTYLCACTASRVEFWALRGRQGKEEGSAQQLPKTPESYMGQAHCWVRDLCKGVLGSSTWVLRKWWGHGQQNHHSTAPHRNILPHILKDGLSGCCKYLWW